ncbi:hypothetical protein DQ04_02211000 [Trypanosoma grayi]|uniref:hypothetical protein n=1 Tax=Trypanosoma grayi TaxID=71804 RepID=UPI0004F45B5A|nr:hypothetical protein DQ04_02211000 [Trypanosoma grayi]KEG11851.1 hypothetical protein DQ04_02211000 [Trypanosoma grayi]
MSSGIGLQQHCGSLHEQGLPHGLSTGAVNFFMAAGEGYARQRMESQTYWGSGAPQQQTSSAPVYGPSKAPRLEQFVDLSTNSGGMTPFFGLGDVANDAGCRKGETATAEGKRREDETKMEECRVMLYPAIVFNTPQQQKQEVRVSVGTPTPFSAMGMTLSPATVGRDLAFATPASTVASGSTARVEPRARPLLRNANGSTTSTTPTTATATPGGVPNSLATELESAFEEQPLRRRVEVKISHRVGGDAAPQTAEMDTTRGRDDTPPGSKEQGVAESGRRERASRRRGKDQQRQVKPKNGSPQQAQRGNNTRRSLLHALSAYEGIHSGNDNRKFLLDLQCHGGRTATVLSCMELQSGTHIIFEGDRGVDLGEVVKCEESNNTSSGGPGGNDRETLHAVRCATDEEVEEWKGDLVAKEEEAVIQCRAACEELGLTIRVASAAFQFDRQKLIFMYESDERVDFRTLLQAMFSKYRCRIWMERLNAEP